MYIISIDKLLTLNKGSKDEKIKSYKRASNRALWY
jgi:hypothetical protein